MKPSQKAIEAAQSYLREVGITSARNDYDYWFNPLAQRVQAAIDEAYKRGRLDQHADQFQINKTMKIWSSSRPAQDWATANMLPGRPTCPCGFQGNTRNIREHRGNCEAWRQHIEEMKSRPAQEGQAKGLDGKVYPANQRAIELARAESIPYSEALQRVLDEEQ